VVLVRAALGRLGALRVIMWIAIGLLCVGLAAFLYYIGCLGATAEKAQAVVHSAAEKVSDATEAPGCLEKQNCC